MNKIDEKLFNEMAELVNLQNEEEFLFFIDKNSDLLKVDPILFIGNHIAFYAEQENVNKAIEVVNHYKNSPYISMEVEDFLNEMLEELTSLNISNKKTNHLPISKDDIHLFKLCTWFQNYGCFWSDFNHAIDEAGEDYAE